MKFLGPIDASSNKILAVATPTADTDAVNKSYVDSSVPDRIKEINDNTVLQFWIGTKAEYDAIVTKNPNTQYTVTDEYVDDITVVTAEKLSAARTITLTGDVTGSVDTDFSGNASITTTVADNSHNHTASNISDFDTEVGNNTTVAANTAARHTHSNKTVLDGITATVTELNYVGGVTGAIQTQLNAKAPIASPTFTGNVVLPATTSIGNVTDTEISYLDGTTGNIQTQIAGKASTSHVHVKADVSDFPTISTQPSFRNKIINGNFVINQRVVSGTVVLSAGAYGHDRWKAGASGCTYTFATSANRTTITITAGSLIQIVEGINLQSGTHILSWTGTAQGKIGAGTYGASGVTGAATGGANLSIEFSTGTLSNVQLEFGSVSTEFEDRPITVEQSLCERYFEKSWETTVVTTEGTASTGVDDGFLMEGMQKPFRVIKRAWPTITWYSPTSGEANKVSTKEGERTVSTTYNGSTRMTGTPQLSTGITMGWVRAHWSADAEL